MVGLVQHQDYVHERHPGKAHQADIVKVVEDFLKLSIIPHNLHDFIKREIFLVRHDVLQIILNLAVQW